MLKILVLALAAVVLGPRAVEASFLDDFSTPGLVSYTGSNSYGSGGSFTVSGGKLNIKPGADNTFSVMTSNTVGFNVDDALSLDVPAISGTESVFMMCSTAAAQPNGSITFGFRFRRGGGIVRIDLSPGGSGTNTADPCSARPAILIVTRTSDTGFEYSIKIEGAQYCLGSFALPNLAGNYNLHVGAQAYKQTSGTTFAFDNLLIPGIHNITRDIWYSSIQASINDANDGDQIEVAPGTYYEAINFKGKAVRLYSSAGSDVTTINGNGAYHVVQCVSSEDANTILEGFKITGGNANGASSPTCDGGGMFNDHSSPTVINCDFTYNKAGYGAGMYNGYGSNPAVIGCTFSFGDADYWGGGIFNKQSNPTVTNCRFIYDSAHWSGGGMFNEDSSPTVNNCNFYNNNAELYTGGGMYSKGYSSPTVTDCNFTGNNTGFPGGSWYEGYGGAMCNEYYANTTVTNCTFSENSANVWGGAMYNKQCTPTVTNCQFNSNLAKYYGGGIFNEISSPTLIDCNFSYNDTNQDGGGMYSKNGSNPTLTNCNFTGNTADSNGGGIYNFDNSSPTVTNCTFTGNKANLNGGGMFNNNNSTPTVTDCTFSGNTASIGGGMNNNNSSPTVTNCTFTGNKANLNGGGMFNNNNSTPTVTDCTFSGNTADYGGGMYNFLDSSPAVTNCNFSGNIADYGGGMSNISSSSPTIINCTFLDNTAISLGGGMFNSISSPTLTNCSFTGNTAQWGGGGGMYNSNSSPTVTNCILWNDTPDEISYDISMPTVTYCDIQGGGYPDANNINADPCFIDAVSGDLRLGPGSPCIDAGNNNALPINIMTDLDGNPRLADDAGIPDTGNGSAPIVDMGAYEKQGLLIHNVTQGNYYLHIQQAINDANNGDEIEVAPGTYYEAINFSGKAVRLYSSWGPQATTIDANGAYHVVQCISGEDANTILEGFTITGGNANGSWPDFCGGGMLNNGTSPTVINCTFSMNTATERGGGMYNLSSSPIVTDCNFSKNTAQSFAGGGMYNETGSNPIVTNCSFTGNTAANDGGGIYNLNSSSPTITNCTFSGNSVYYCGGGIYNLNSSSPFVTNCTFFGNSVSYSGGYYGGGMYNNNSSNPTVTNCIFWNDLDSEILNIDSSPIITYSDIQGGTGQLWFGTGCIDADPCFINADANDFHLSPYSPCIDAGNNAAVPSSITTDLSGLPRFIDSCKADTGSGTPPIVDMGAYEAQPPWTTHQNLLVNPGFETGNATGWITNWGWNLTATTEQVHNGNYSGLISGRTASWQGAWQSVMGLMDDGKTYRISGWVRLQNADSNHVALTVSQTDSGGAHYYGIDNATAYNDRWTLLDGTFVLNVNGSLTDLHIYFEGPAAGVNFYVDDAAVTEVMGDLDHNGGVNFFDFGIFAQYYGFDCSTQDCALANLYDCDNTINELDLAILVADWLVGI